LILKTLKREKTVQKHSKLKSLILKDRSARVKKINDYVKECVISFQSNIITELLFFKLLQLLAKKMADYVLILKVSD